MYRLFLIMIATVAVPFAGAQIPTGDMARGERLFKDMQCATCHSVNKAGGTIAPDLSKRNDTSYTPNALAASMWSHASGMWQAMEKAKIQRAQMTPQQAADLFAFFAGGHRTDKMGDPAAGAKLYQSKNCASCHEESYLGAPSLAAQAGKFSSFSMVSSLWQHGAGMLSRMVSKNTEWQKLTPEELTNLIAYLNSKRK
jgi:mono/diheme cytochrome c family protein